jgi:FkbH-like protein
MLELDEVRRAFPRMECLRFTPGDPGEVVRLLERLRDLFGRPTVTAEDLSRTASLQAAVAFESNRAVHEDPLDFIKQLEGTVTIRRDHPDDAPRALQLTNKTNQFNLNGDRIAETDLQALLAADEGFVLVVSYADRYGSLGRIGVVAGRLGVDTLEVLHWVLSCRAFSRFIEHHMLQRVLALAERRTVRLAYRETPRNSPLREFLGTLGLQFEGTEPVVLPSATADALAKLAPHATDGGRDA